MSSIHKDDPMYNKSSIKYWRSHHPVIVGIAVACLPSAAYILWKFTQLDYKRDFITKYKTQYIVCRPDDPQAKMLKTGPIGLDRFTKANP